MRFMYISNGEMGLYDGVSAKPVVSQRVEQFARTLKQLEAQHAWKTEGSGAQFMHMSNPYAGAASRQRGWVTGLVGRDGDILYAVDLGGETGGVYTKDPEDPDAAEGLVTSAVGFLARDLICAGESIYAALNQGAESHIIRMNPVSGQYDILTDGDTQERHPFLSADGGTLYFDMRGLARDEQRRLLARGPSAIAGLNLRTGEIREVHLDENLEFSKYTESEDGTRRMLVRPYKAPSSKVNPLGCLIAPFSALAGFIHVFSAINAARKGKEPPMQASNGTAARQRGASMMVDGVDIDLNKAVEENKKHGESYPGIIPWSWRLVRILDDGTQETLRHGVLDYTPLPDGGYLYSNGSQVLRADADGTVHPLFKAELATDLIPLEEKETQKT